jgi:molybdate-binding protein
MLTTQVNGFENSEFTHSAVAAYIASGMADVGFGVQTAAQRFKLDFIPLMRERYFFAVPTESLEQPQMQRVVNVLRSDSFRSVVNQLPGYDAADTGTILTMAEAFGSPPKK